MAVPAQKDNLLRAAFRELMKGVCTSVPGHILTYDPGLQRAQVQVGIQVVSTSGFADGLPPVADVPVLFLGGTQFSMTHQINPGDEGLIVFSQRCVDGWKQTGGVATNPLTRFHDMHDAFFIPGFRPLPTRISGFANDGIRMQSRDGGRYVWIKQSGEIVADNGEARVRISAGGEVNIENGAGYIRLGVDGRVNINGAIINADGTIDAPNVTFGGVSGNDHRHTNIQPGTGTSGGPIN
ncbi:Gp138 family membrane-puncturing spike protein [Bordetella bronchiseptica]|uniref:Gp138 family membrane-puncturing spike protein n=1 Tax=Bordetella bronchiseptica TaxID=518 RepID=UPI00052933CD|nr:Gp138 family membrane-puncturing spike protein [Bordetella bronchiseptica]